ncbi:MAG: hypothetical protein Q4G08_01235 [Capnocytophaga sp.]|nr:hypothetical protein [Capnocytophaga sp.]
MRFVTLILVTLVAVSCKSEGEIAPRQARKIIENHLANSPLYETGNFNTYKQKLDSNKDHVLLNSLETLADNGLIEINNEKTRKKWFSKDTVLILSPMLTKAALPYVVKHDKNSVTVKTIVYELNDKDIVLEKNSNKTAVCTAVLDKEKTPFYEFGKDPHPNHQFITRKFRLKYDEKSGWKVVK